MAKASKLADLFRSAFDKANKEKADLTNKLNDLLEQGRKIEEQVAAVKKELAEADENISTAVKAAGKDFGISLEVDAGKGRGRPAKGQQTGSSKATVAEVKRVLSALPTYKGNAFTSGQVAKAAGCPTKKASTILKQLVADKNIKAAGEKRGKRYWKTA